MRGIQKAIAQLEGKRISQPEPKCLRGPLCTVRLVGEELEKFSSSIQLQDNSCKK